MLQKVKNYIEKWNMLQREDCVIVGVSGGADSICLLLVLAKLQKEYGFRMVAVHVNHGIRGAEADADEVFVKNFCEQLGILNETYYADVELIAKKRKQSTEEAGREIRREFFREAMEKYGGSKIALAHHKNDSAETFLINLARGTGLKGLSGIAPVNKDIIRPLLCVKREEIEVFLKDAGIAYCEDYTNQSDDYTRNRVRNHILPYMKDEINGKVIEHMSETMEQIRQVQEFLDAQVQEYYEKSVAREGEKSIISQNAYSMVPEVLKPLLLKRVLVETAGKEKDIEAVHVKQLQELFQKQVGRKLDLPYQIEGLRTYQGIALGKKKSDCGNSIIEHIFEVNGEPKTFAVGQGLIHCRVTRDNVEKNNTKCFNCDIIKNNISIRSRRQGDYITIHPDGRKQKLKSFFINEKIPQDARDHILLVADGSHILWIVGYRVNPAYAVNTNTKRILEIQIDEGEHYGRDN